MKKGSFLGVIIIVTILLVGTLVIAQAHVFGKGRDKGCDREFRPGMERMEHKRGFPERGCRDGRHRGIWDCLKGLDLSSGQITQLKKVQGLHLEAMEQVREKNRNYKNRVREYLDGTTAANSKALEKLLDEGAGLWRERERERLRFRKKISDILTQGQRDKLFMCEGFRPCQVW